MKSLTEKLERIFMAVAFAEEGEYETAREILKEKRLEQKRETQSPRKIARPSA